MARGFARRRLLSEAERDGITGALAQVAPTDRPALIADLRALYGAQGGLPPARA